MKNLFVLIIFVLLGVESAKANNGGKVQAGIFATGNVLTIKAKPASDYSETSVDNVVFALRWSSTYSGVTVSEITSSFGLAKEGTTWTSGGFVYQDYSSISLTPISWTSSSEYVLGTITVSGISGTGTFEIAPYGTALNPVIGDNDDWYISIGGFDRTPTTGTGTGGELSEFYQANVSNVALPVELTSFTAISKGRNVQLVWNTATETNNYGFEIQKTSHPEQVRPDVIGTNASKGEWTKIGFVEGNGTTNAPKSYSFTDKSAPGKTSYRLKQIDRDGKFEYSQTVEFTAISTPKEFALEQNYPNPFNPSTTINYQLPVAKHVTLKIYDAIGREVSTLVNEVKDAGYYSAQFDGARLSTGIYFARLSSSGKTQMRKLILMK